MLHKRTYTTLAWALFALSLLASPYCDVRKFSILDGLAANNISDLQQGSDNLMWFGTWNGLSYYDGYAFRTFRDNPDQVDLLSTNKMLFVRPTRNYDVWCVTTDRKAYVYDTKICSFVNVGRQINEKFGIDLRVKDIYTLPDHATYITTTHANYILRITSEVFDEANPELIKTGQKGLRSGNIWHVYCDKKGREWILSDKGTTIYGTHFSTPIPFKWIRQMGNTIFLATEDGRLAIYDEHNHLSMIPMPKEVTRINELKNTGYQLLIATNTGILIYNPRTFKLATINVQNPSQPMAEVKKMYVDRENLIWAFTDGQGVTTVNAKTYEKHWLYADAPQPVERTSCDNFFIMEDEHHTLWTIPNHGTFSYYDRKTGRLVPYLLRSNAPGNFRISKITKYTISDQGILWLTGVHELTQINFKQHDYSISKLDEGEDEVKAIAMTGQGIHWDGYANGIVKVSNRLYEKMGYLTPAGSLSQTQQPFSTRGISALFEDSKQRMWIGTNGDGLYLWQDGRLSHFMPSADRYSLPSDKIYDIVADKQGRIWIGTYGGGLCLLQESGERASFISGKNQPGWPKKEFQKVRNITCTTGGDILVGTTNGLLTFSDNIKSYDRIKFHKTRYIEDDTTSLTADDVNYTLVRSNGETFISSLGGALSIITSKNLLQDNLKTKYFHQLNPDEGIVQGFVEDNKGVLWVIREASIDKCDLRKNTMEVFGPNDFDYNMSFTNARPIHDPATDNITVGTPMGTLTFNPAKLRKTNYQPKIIFTSLHYNGDEGNIPILHREKLVIPSDKRNLTISFAALDYTRKYQQHYKYRIDGYTPKGKWIDLKSQHIIGFNRISHGKYVLQVMATNTHGVWGSHVASLPIEVSPTFWESIWGRMLLFLLFICALGGIFYLYNLKQRQNMSHEMSLMKNRFFSDASHKLRTPLTLIGGPVTEVLKREPNISEESKSLLLMVQRNTQQMLDMLNKMLKFDNNSNFCVDDGGTDSVFATEGDIDDANAHKHLATEQQEEKQYGETGKDGRLTLLVVEDNKDLRQFLCSILHTRYHVLLAENGKVGLAMARKHVPDFILTDVTMPVMDGITMIHYIKQDANIAHIPIVILSAKASVEDQLKGFEEGIDGYLTKPFSATYLKGRIESVISHHKAIQQDMLRHMAHTVSTTYGADEDPMPESTIESESSIHDETTQKIMQFIIEKIDDPDLRIDDIARAMNMSRSVLYSKIKNAVGMTPVDFVRHIRITKATELLVKTNDPLSNIAYNVGFSDPKYFSKVFKKEMGIIPSEYRERNKKH